jgi:transcriptional regulator with XRE-family HTH domain
MPKSMFSDAYGKMIDVIVAARRERKLTQAAVAFALGKPQSFIAKVENGERRLDIIEFCALAEAMNMEPGELFASVATNLPRPLSI